MLIFKYKHLINYELSENTKKVISYLANLFINGDPSWTWANREEIKELFHLKELESLFIIEEIDELGGIDQFSDAQTGVFYHITH